MYIVYLYTLDSPYGCVLSAIQLVVLSGGVCWLGRVFSSVLAIALLIWSNFFSRDKTQNC